MQFPSSCPSLKNLSGGPDIQGTYNNCRKTKRKFKMQPYP